jgi:hypothetical protein
MTPSHFFQTEQSDHFIPEQQLIGAVIRMAVYDACHTPIKVEKELKLTDEAKSAHRFLWTDAVESYLHWLDVDTNFFREKLIKLMGDMTQNSVAGFSSDQRRAFRLNKLLWEDSCLTTRKVVYQSKRKQTKSTIS